MVPPKVHLVLIATLFLFFTAVVGVPAAGFAGQASGEQSFVLVAQAPDSGAATEADEFDDDLLALDEEEPVQVSDPLEGFNRAMFKFNDFMYFYAFKPLSQAWKAVVFEPVRVGIKNAFYNLRMPIRFVNCLLQGKAKRAGAEMGQFLLNSTFGLGGLFDVAEGVNLNPPAEDFGQTLGSWGAGHGPYIVWPLLGPSSLRDTAGKAVDNFLDPITWVFWEFGDDDSSLIELQDEGQEFWIPLGITMAEQINDLSFRIGDYEALKESSLDPYVGLRSAYIQSRNADTDE